VESIEASARSVEEAVQQALGRLGKRREEVDVLVLQEPSRGTFGIGSKDALVRVSVRPGPSSAIITPEMADAILGDDVDVPLPEDSEVEIYDEEYVDEDDEEYEEGDEEEYEEEEEAPAPTYISPAVLGQVLEQPIGISEEDGQEEERPSREDIEITVDALQQILRHLNIHATVQVRSADPLTLNIQGMHQNLALLIGRRGETLAALQLLVSLIVRHRTKRRLRIVVDAENYRLRREENLRSLALRVAQQVRNYRRSIALEAMPPHERRIVHLALAESRDISTESIGEGEERRVVISLKRPGR
jgi:spoIIIJ-associated protein